MQTIVLRSFLIFTFSVGLFTTSNSDTVAQDLDNVSFSGRVSDQNGASLPGAIVTAILIKTGMERTALADAEGRYHLFQLEPGLYRLKAQFTNFAIEEKTNLSTIAGQNVQLNFVLQPAGVSVDALVITEADAPAIDTTRTVVGGTVTSREIESLPVATRSPLDLIFTLPGVSEEALSTRDLAEDRNTTHSSTPEESGTFSLSGGPAYSNNITIDGLDNNDDRAARERFQPSIESVEEVQIITNQFSAEYGRASGGRINIRTRGGSNQYRGRAFYFFRNDILNANTSNNQARGLPRLPLEQHNPGITFSGPLRLPLHNGSDRTFFFSAYEYDTTLDSATIDTLVPIERNPLFPIPGPTVTDPAVIGKLRVKSGIAPFVSTLSTPVKNHIFTTRVDHQFSETHNGSVLYQMGRLNNLRQFGGGNRLAESLIGKTRGTDAISYTDNFVLSSTLVNQTRVQFSRLTPSVTSGGTGPVVLITLDDPLSSSDPSGRSGTLVAGASTAGATDRRESRVQLQNVLAWVVGNHALRFGADMQRVSSTFIDLSDVSGTYSFDNAAAFIANAPSRFRQNFKAESTQKNTYLGFFVQDEWRLRTNLVFSFGLRYETETILRDRNNWGPRVSIALDPKGSGKTVVRLGAGLFYNRALLRTIDDFTLGAQQLFFDTNALIDPATGQVGSADFRRNFLAANFRFPEVLTVDSPLVTQFGVLNTGFSRRLDPALRIPESYQANIGIERELGRGFVFEGNLTLNRGLHLWREFNANAPRLPAGFENFSQYLASHDFANFRSTFGVRPIYNASSAGDLVRFVFNPADPSNPAAVVRINEFGLPISLINLNSVSSSTPVEAALAALNGLRPDPSRTEVEQLVAAGNSYYRGITIELRRRFKQTRWIGLSFRAAYTFSYMEDDGVVNTSDALVVGDFAAERARSLLDRRHRFVFSGTFKMPAYLGEWQLSPILRLASGAPFNISIGGADRNLDDVGNDRPIFTGDASLLRWRSPGDPLDASILDHFSLPTIGRTGNLSRNAGQGPGQFFFDLSLTREFKLKETLRFRPTVEFNNVLNKTVYSFGSEFINFNALGPNATVQQRSALIDSFLVTTRTLRPRQIRLGVRFDF